MKTCAVTGANGWLGRCVVAAFQRHGWNVRKLVRTAPPSLPADGAAARYQLGDTPAPELLEDVHALVHCAYDSRGRTWKEIEALNVVGTGRLIVAAKAAAVERIVCISTMSAFPGCVSLYGRAKLEIERIALEAGALVLRPGLIHGNDAGGMFGRLVSQVRSARVLPLLGGGRQVLHLVHEHDLAEFICRYCVGEIQQPKVPLTAAHPQGWTFRQILEVIAGHLGQQLTFLPLPWRAVWAGLKMAELCRVPLDFRSDSLVSLMNQNPHPDFSANSHYGLICRPFEIAPMSGGEPRER